MPKSKKRGKNTSKPEVQGIDAHGIWLMSGDREYFLPFESYPWFKRARVSDILKVLRTPGGNLHWPNLDVDLEVESLADPEGYPLVYRD